MAEGSTLFLTRTDAARAAAAGARDSTARASGASPPDAGLLAALRDLALAAPDDAHAFIRAHDELRRMASAAPSRIVGPFVGPSVGSSDGRAVCGPADCDQTPPSTTAERSLMMAGAP